MYDAIIVGGRCAGAATALQLAREGLKVLVVDKSKFPSDIPHGHFIHRQGPSLLNKWGVLNDIVASGCPPVTKVTTDLGDFPLTGTDLEQGGVALGYGPRRVGLDSILINAAVSAGAEFRDGFLVEDFLQEGDAIRGIAGRARDGGAAVQERTRITIGADGRHSSLARTVKASVYDQTPSLTCWYFSYWSGAGIDGLEVHIAGRNVIFAFPTNDGLSSVLVAWDVSAFDEVRGDIAGNFMSVLKRVPALYAKIADGKREERFYGAADLPNFFRKPYGDGWALVGDAGHHKDPYLALGISDAFRDAELLASAIARGASGDQPLPEALARYEEERNAAAMQSYGENLHLAQFKPLPPEALAIRAAVRGNREQTNRFYMAQHGMIPKEAFFNPENLQRLNLRSGESKKQAGA